MKRVIILRGLPASGKSTYSTRLIKEEKGRWVRVNKDLLREMCHASEWSPSNEKFILKLRDTTILQALEDGKHVIVDDTNLAPYHIDRIKELVKGQATVEVNDEFLQVPVEECIQRDLQRLKSVGKDVIMKMYNQYIRPQSTAPEHNPNLPNAIIVDMDGTLALMGDRSPYDVSKCDRDLPNIPVLDTVKRWQSDTQIIIVSGRTDDGYDLTAAWLQQHGIEYKALLMRQKGDTRKDSIVKAEIYHQSIVDNYNVKFILDDRQQVVDMWRSLGLTVFQVAEGDF
jgi:predicted kinase